MICPVGAKSIYKTRTAERIRRPFFIAPKPSHREPDQGHAPGGEGHLDLFSFRLRRKRAFLKPGARQQVRRREQPPAQQLAAAVQGHRQGLVVLRVQQGDRQYAVPH